MEVSHLACKHGLDFFFDLAFFFRRYDIISYDSVTCLSPVPRSFYIIFSNFFFHHPDDRFFVLDMIACDKLPWRACPFCIWWGFYNHRDDSDSIGRQTGHERNRVRGVRRHLRCQGGGGPPQRLQRLRPVSHRALLPGKLYPFETWEGTSGDKKNVDYSNGHCVIQWLVAELQWLKARSSYGKGGLGMTLWYPYYCCWALTLLIDGWMVDNTKFYQPLFWSLTRGSQGVNEAFLELPCCTETNASI